MNMLQTTQTTMSSREISDLVESRHDSVKRSMETLQDSGLISFTQSVETSHDGAGARPVAVYLVNKRDSYVVGETDKWINEALMLREAWPD